MGGGGRGKLIREESSKENSGASKKGKKYQFIRALRAFEGTAKLKMSLL